MNVINLGWGVQSFGMAAMSAKGILPPVVAAVHSNATYERAETYAFAQRWTPWLEAHGVRVVTVTPPNTEVIRQWKREPAVMIPAYATWLTGESSGMIHRQCTGEWKIRPVRRWLQANRKGQQVQSWIGITLDEVTRMSQSDVKYQVLTYPFIEMLDRPWTRHMVMRWLQDNDLEIPVKSSCVFCPFYDRATWREIQQANTGDWEKAITIDKAIREPQPGYLCYLTRDRKPLVDCDFRSQEDHGQLTLWDEECEGAYFL